MDTDTYENIEIELPKEQEMRQKIEQACNEGSVVYIRYWVVLDTYKIIGMVEGH